MGLTRRKLRYIVYDALPFEFKRGKCHPDAFLVDLIVGTIFNQIKEGLLKDNRVVIQHFGTFYINKNHVRPKVRFKACRKFKKVMNEQAQSSPGM